MSLTHGGIQKNKRLILLNQDNGINGDAFLTACEAKFLRCRSLNGNVIGVTADDICYACLHGGDMGVHLGPFGADGGIDIH